MSNGTAEEDIDGKFNMLYKEFNLTDEEITEVEQWYEHNRN